MVAFGFGRIGGREPSSSLTFMATKEGEGDRCFPSFEIKLLLEFVSRERTEFIRFPSRVGFPVALVDIEISVQVHVCLSAL